MRNFLTLIFLFCIVGFNSCSSEKVNEAKKTFVTKVSEKVQAAAVHSLGCRTGMPVYEMTKEKLSMMAKVKSTEGFAKSSMVKNLCEYGVTTVFPYMVDLGTGKLPQSWIDDDCTMDSVGNDIEKVAKDLCKKLE